MPGPMLLVIEHDDTTGIGRLREILTDHAHRLDVRRTHRGEALPADLDDIDGVISCGGTQSANDETPFLRREMEILAEAHRRELPVLGICLGSQLLAKALGGEVTPLAGGPEIGWAEVTLSPIGREDPLFMGIAWRSHQLHWHSEEVAKLPEEARLLASSARCRAQAWGAGLRTYGIQYHPELDAAGLQRLLRDGAHELNAAGLSATAILEAAQTHLADMERLATRLFESWALLVAPVDRR